MQTKTKLTLTIILLIGGVFLSTLGGLSLWIYFYPPVNHSYIGYRGETVGLTNYQEISRMQIGFIMFLPQKSITLLLNMTFDSASTSTPFYVTVFVPFSIDSPIQNNTNFGSIPHNMTTINDQGGGVLQVLFYQGNMSDTYTFISFNTTEDLYSGEQGDYSFTFPTAGPIPEVENESQYCDELPKCTVIDDPRNYETVVEVGLSNGSLVESGYPDSYSPIDVNETYNRYSPAQWLSWTFNQVEPSPVSVGFSDNSVKTNYSNDLFLGGILTTTGISIISAIAVQYLDPWQNNPSIEVLERVRRINPVQEAATTNIVDPEHMSRMQMLRTFWSDFVDLGVGIILMGIGLYTIEVLRPNPAIISSSFEQIFYPLGYSVLLLGFTVVITAQRNFSEDKRNMIDSKKTDQLFAKVTTMQRNLLAMQATMDQVKDKVVQLPNH